MQALAVVKHSSEVVRGKWAALPRWAKWAIIGGTVLVVARGAAGLTVTTIKQGDPKWSGKQLGTGSSTIGGAGCLLTALTMASNRLTGSVLENLTPDVVNDLLVSAGAFVGGSNLSIPAAAEALGLRASGVFRDDDNRSIAEIRQSVDSALDNGGFAILHVTKKVDTNTGQHFILVHARHFGGSYTAADPATGKDIKLNSDLAGAAPGGQYYRPTAVAPVFLDGGETGISWKKVALFGGGAAALGLGAQWLWHRRGGR